MGSTDGFGAVDEEHCHWSVRGLPKGIKQVLMERNLWVDRRDGFKFLTDCSKTEVERAAQRILMIQMKVIRLGFAVHVQC